VTTNEAASVELNEDSEETEIVVDELHIPVSMPQGSEKKKIPTMSELSNWMKAERNLMKSCLTVWDWQKMVTSWATTML
jgi:hypothetical protein